MLINNNKRLITSLNSIINQAENAGLSKRDLNIAKEYIDHFEFGLSLEYITVQLFEFNIQINQEFYDAIVLTGELMEIKEGEYSYLKSLILS